MPQPTASIAEPVALHASSKATRRRATPHARAAEPLQARRAHRRGGRGPRLCRAADGDRDAQRRLPDRRDRRLGPRLSAIRAGEAELLESEQRDLRRHLASDGFVLTDRIEALDAADLVLICVPTPVDEQLLPDPRILREACAAVVRHARPGQTLVLTSTTYVGCTRELLVEPLAERGLRVGEDVFVAFAPERIDPGVAGHEQLQTPRVIGGVTETCFRRAAELLRHTCKHLHRVSSPEAAEMVKLLREHLPRGQHRARVRDRRSLRHPRARPDRGDRGRRHQALRLHGALPLRRRRRALHRGRSPLPAAPLRERGRPATVAEEALRKLAGRPRHVAWRAHEVLVELGRRLADARILVVGVSYKPGVADTREAPAVEIIARLRAEGAHVDYHDPLVPELELERWALIGVTAPAGAGWSGGQASPIGAGGAGLGPEDYDLAILATVHPDHDYGWLARCPAVLDCTYRTPGGRRRFLP